jgi:hypothetical protein
MANNTTLAVLKLYDKTEDKEEDACLSRNILQYSYTFECPTDKENQPSGIPRGGRLSLTLDSLTNSKNAATFFQLAKDKKHIPKGQIIVQQPSSAEKNDLKVLTFEDAYCVKFKETWKDMRENKGESANTEDIEITWKILKWDEITYENEWVGKPNVAGGAGMSVISGVSSMGIGAGQSALTQL